MADSFEFSYTTPGTDLEGNPIQIPTTFRLGGITPQVARAIRGGLRKETSITNVELKRVTETLADVGGADP